MQQNPFKGTTHLRVQSAEPSFSSCFSMALVIPVFLLLLAVSGATSRIVFEDPLRQELRPETFFLSRRQEFQLISKVICEDIPCPEFNVVRDLKDFIQLRTYRASNFLTVQENKLCNYKLSFENGLRKTKKYFEGFNERDQKFPVTIPVLIKVNQYTTIATSNPWCKLAFTYSVFVPHYWEPLPKPNDATLDFRPVPEDFQVYVHTFAGPVETQLFKEIEIFRSSLKALRLCYKSIRFYIAIYQIPHSPSDSRNELWFEKC